MVNRFRVEETEGAAFLADLRSALAVLAERPGYVDGRIGRNMDDATLWVLTTRWANVGSYRRALSHYDVKLRSVPLLDQAAVAAVMAWEYTPTLLNGQPVPIIMTVTVRFRLQ